MAVSSSPLHMADARQTDLMIHRVEAESMPAKRDDVSATSDEPGEELGRETSGERGAGGTNLASQKQHDRSVSQLTIEHHLEG